MTKYFIGRFYFKLTDSKNLIGEFSNNHETCKRNYTESADRFPQNANAPRNADDDKFIGEYFTTWHEENHGEHEHGLAKLKISRKHDGIYSLTWWLVQDDGQVADIPSFRGEGMLCDGILIGDYRNFVNCDSLPAHKG